MFSTPSTCQNRNYTKHAFNVRKKIYYLVIKSNNALLLTLWFRFSRIFEWGTVPNRVSSSDLEFVSRIRFQVRYFYISFYKNINLCEQSYSNMHQWCNTSCTGLMKSVISMDFGQLCNCGHWTSELNTTDHSVSIEFHQFKNVSF